MDYGRMVQAQEDANVSACVVEFIKAHQQYGCHQAITVYLGSAEAPLD